MIEPLVEVRDVCVGYGRVPVLREVSLDVRPGEVVALFGPNGAGKTTTLLTIAGELRPSSGTVSLFGELVDGPLHRRARAGLGFLPEERSVFRTLTVAENVALGRGSADAVRDFAPELVPLWHRRAGLLSGGEQQLLAMARALAAEPRLLVADELSLGLAPKIVTRILQAIRQAANDGVGVLLVEQHVDRALEIADRAYVLHRGRIEVACSADELQRDRDLVERTYLGAAV